MREGAQREITLEDCSMGAVQVFISLIYTATLPADEADPEVDTLLEALTLAHRWHAQHVVEMIAEAVARRLDTQTFEAIIGTALQLSLSKLLAACRAHIVTNRREVQVRLRGQAIRQPAVRAEVARVLGCEDPSHGETAREKKRRRAL